MTPSSSAPSAEPRRGRRPTRIAAGIAGLLLVGVSVFGAASSASAAPISTPVFTNPAPGLDPDAQPQVEGDLQVEADLVDVVVTVTNSNGTGTYCTDAGIDTTVTPFFSCNGAVLPFGDNTFTATAFFSAPNPDTAPGPTSAPLVYTRYGIGPVTTNVPANPTDQATLAWSGTGPALGFVDIILEDDSRACDDVPIAADGTWSCEAIPLGPGLYATQVEARDALGNNVVGDGPFNITITPPTSTIQQTFAPPWYTTGSPQVQGGMSEDAVTVNTYVSPNPGGPFTTPYCSGPNNDPDLTIWFCTPPANVLSPGTNYIVSQVVNSAGAVGAFSAPIEMTLVSNPAITTPVTEFYTNDPTVSFIGTADDAYFDTARVAYGDEAQYDLCSSAVLADSTWNCETPALPDGFYDAVVEATPNFIYSSRVNITVDTVVPVPPTVNPLSTAIPAPTVTGTGEPFSTITVFIDGGIAGCSNAPVIVDAGGNWACALAVAPGVGTHDVSARQVDRAGNISADAPNLPLLTITIPDVAPPLPAPVTPTPTPTPTPTLIKLVWLLGEMGTEYEPGDSVLLSGTGLPAGAVANAEIHSTPQKLGSAIADATGRFEIAASIPDDIEPGDHTFVITVTAAGAEPSTVEYPVVVMAPEEQKGTVPKNDEPKVIVDDAIAGGEAVGEVDRNSPNAPSAMTTALDTVLDIIGNPVVIASAAAVGIGLLLFVAIPAELLNATLSEQYGRIAKRVPRLKKSPGWWAALTSMIRATPVIGAMVITVLTAVIFGFADPRFGFDLTSLRVVLACAIGLLFVGFIANALTGIIVAKRWGLSTRMEIKPLGVILAVIGVVLSRLLEFSPGIMIGLLLGVALVGRATRRDEVRSTLTKAGILFAFAVIAWLVYSFTSGSLADQSFGANLFLETLVAISTEGLTALAIGLLPFKFLEGESLWNYSKPLWAGAWIFAAAAFTLIVVPNNFAEINGSLWVWGLVVAGFAVIASAIYLYFRFFAPSDEDDESEEAATEERVEARH